MCHLIKCYLITGSKKPVKFSAEPDLPTDVCEHLLEKYIPPSIRNTKTLQQLFLRYLSSKAYMNMYMYLLELYCRYPWLTTSQLL